MYRKRKTYVQSSDTTTIWVKTVAIIWLKSQPVFCLPCSARRSRCASRGCGGDGEVDLLAGAAQAVPVALLPPASPPPYLLARRLPLPATASLRCGLPAPDHRCQGRAGGGQEWGGPARLGLDTGGRLGLPAREGTPSQVGAKVST